MADEINVQVKASIAGLQAAMAEASESVRGFAEQTKGHMEAVSESFAGIKEGVEIFLAALAVEKIEAFFEKFAQQATQIERLSLEFGIATDAVQGLQFAMAATGGSGDQLQMVFSRMSVAMEKALAGDGPQREAFAKMGIDLQFLQTHANDAQGVLYKLADGVKEAGTGAQTAAVLIALLGRSGASLQPLLKDGSEGMKELQKNAEAVGGVMSELEIHQFEGIHKSLTTMDAAFNGLGITIADAFGPAFKAIVDGITEAIGAMNGGAEHTGILRTALVALVAPIDIIVLGFEEIKIVLMGFYETARYVFDNIVILFTALGKAVNDFRTGNINRLGDDWNNAMVDMDKSTVEHFGKIRNEMTDLGKTAADMMAGLSTLMNGGGKAAEEKPPAPPKPAKKAVGGGADNTELQIEKNDLATELELQKLGLAGKKEIDQAKVASGELSQAQMLNNLKQYTYQEYDYSWKALTDEQKLYDEDSAEWNALNNKKLILTQQYHNAVNKINLEAANQQKQLWQGIATSMQQASTQMLNGILQGTQTWQQAMAKLFDNLLLKFIDDFAVKAVTTWVASEAQKLAASQSMSSLLIALGITTATTTTTTDGVKNVAEVEGAAAVAAANTFASTAAIPIVGPALAPAAAGAAYADVMATYVPLASFDVGSWQIPRDMMANIHQGEMIIPKPFADSIRENGGMGGGGGGTVHLHINAMDTQSGAQFIQKHGRAIAQAVNTQIRNANQNLTGMKAFA